MVARAGPLATRNCESRQVRKEATAAVDVCAGVGTVWVASIHYKYKIQVCFATYIEYLPRSIPHV